MESIAPAAVLIFIILLIDLYTFKGLRLLTSGLKKRWMRVTIHVGYWLVTAFSVVAIFWLAINITEVQDNRDYRTFFTLAGLVMLVVAPKFLFMAFHLMADVGFLVARMVKKPVVDPDDNGERISRSKFLTQIGLVMAALPFAGMIYGMIKGRFDFRVMRQRVVSSKIPKAFDGLRIVHISDAHLGSFYGNFSSVQEGFRLIQDLRADIIVFTGDWVNNYADETEGWEPYFAALQAPMGKFAILGNHDYGDYVPWDSEEDQMNNLAKLRESIGKMGFRLLLNNHVTLNKNGEAIDLIGVENWGTGPFARYGDLKKASEGAKNPFKILLSHDPSHWDEEVLGHTDIDLTLSGHTHGMQFGIEVPGIKWSPAQYRYPRWGGLYTEGKQHLYVNRGFGYIGFPGRVGIPPEITLIELQSA